jgi:hypothetical protein
MRFAKSPAKCKRPLQTVRVRDDSRYVAAIGIASF